MLGKVQARNGTEIWASGLGLEPSFGLKTCLRNPGPSASAWAVTPTRQMLLLSSSLEGKAMQNRRCTTSSQRLAHLAFKVRLLLQRAYCDFHFSLCHNWNQKICFLSCIPNTASTETTEEQQPQLCLSLLQGLSRTIRSTTPFVPGFPSAALQLIFMRMLKNKVFSKRT